MHFVSLYDIMITHIFEVEIMEKQIAKKLPPPRKIELSTFEINLSFEVAL